MNISDESRKVIVNEIGFVIKMMDKSQDPSQKLYYFSGVYALIQRIINQDFDKDLVLAHLVLKHTYESFQHRFHAIYRGGDKTIVLNDEQLNGIGDCLKEFSKAIEKKESINIILNKFAILAYSTTGNGFYLLQKGMLKM